MTYGRRYIETVDELANAPANDYEPGTLIFATSGGNLYLQKQGIWKLVTVAA